MAGESTSFDGQEHGGKRLSEKIVGMIENLDLLPASSHKHCCIYKVSDHIRKSNEEAYTPQVISIGPFHRNKSRKLQKMEDFKLRYLKSFTDRAETKLEDIVSTIKGAEESVRECYSETIPLGSDEFVEMILVDASFIIEYFWRNKTKGNWTDYDQEILKPWLCNRMQMDLILLENQLPFFIIEIIYDIAFPSRSKEGHPFIELSFCQFEYYNVQNFRHSESEKIFHFTDLVRNFCMPPPERRPQRGYRNMREMYSAAQLDKVGLKFKKRESSNINWSPLELELKYADGVLEIPPFQLDSSTEIYARNLVAFEECHYRSDAYITDYYILLSMLIKTVKDIDVLVREQIIHNWLDGVVATSMINKLSGEKLFYFQMNSDYHGMAEKLNKFYNNQSKPIITFRRVLFRSPLTGATTISASVMLILTFVQCVCYLLSLKSVF
ncbi:UPF0481 protein At3g47200-like [Juglans microcarpa x Juglans regia]|uniref:UPF0481 protein At3g47200-like n=1 Tax=Juglans microcarpa x Juglans regia TaxID=2249226 RepID=UPI001B7D93A5|nr:UPF0481 protein At3g47200-like [Juglans microcarpa x Juglans regia]XP_040996415.1 UPF0481 protein At3g47200-like [Juglans microcarpa x Juglans regia]XP_040996416.1 UPF0481 protein At3g47200-like [Juglans microcarpa x Juglans regia]XP_040996417.1 UPF0481 protein At3g47200-like [Juglans microcarpa x Juglans regia]